MQKLLTVFVLLLISLTAPAQSVKPIAAKVQQAHQTTPVFRQVSLFGSASTNLDALPDVKNGVEEGVLLSWNAEAVQALRARPDRPVNIVLPTGNGSSMTLELVPAKGLSDDFEVRVASEAFSRPYQVDKGTHYWGIVDGDPTTTAVISVFDHEIAGLIATQNEQYVLGPVEHADDKTHILYKNSRLKGTNSFECGADNDEFHIGTPEGETAARVTTGPDNCVRMFIEADYTLFQNKGSVANVTSYMTAVFTQVSALYTNEAINLNMHSLYVWDVTDPYTGPSASNYLTQFRTAKNGVFNGDLAHLVGIHGLGGVAYVGVLCFPTYGVGYSSINSTYSNVPVYSWTVEVLSHEIGHNLGSPHTHACAWNGNNTAIDGCAPTYNPAYAEGTCATGPLPTGTGGTVMSYCHLLSSVGINFNNGFGPQPGDLVRSQVYNASCLTSCGVVTVPNAPTGLAATTASSTQINLTWTDNATNETAYKVERGTTNTGPWTEIAAALPAGTTSYSATGLAANTTYFFQVRAANSAGNSAYSNIASATTQDVVPAAPSSLTATVASSSQINLSWLDNASNETSYKVERATAAAGPWTEIASALAANSTAYSATGLSSATTYYFRVRAAGSAGNSAYSNTANATTSVVAPSDPTNLVATAASTSQINLTWTDNASNETAYKVERATAAAGPWTEIAAALAANTTSYSATGLSAGTTYYFRVRASNAGGNSGYSNIANAATPMTPPAAPTSLTATAASAYSITLAWTDNATNESEYKVERATASAGPWTEIAAGLPAGSTGYTAAGLNPVTTYYFRVRAANAGGNSAYSNTANATTPAVPPATPTNLTATATSTTQINLTWTDNATNETAYKVERATSSAGPWTQLTGTLAANTTAYSATGLTAGTTYYFQVRASNTAGNSAYSNIANATTLTTPPAKPTGLAATVVSSTQINLTWTDVATETSYQVDRATASAGPWTNIAAALPANTTSYSATGLSEATLYYFRIRAGNSGGYSAYSSTVNKTTYPHAPTNLTASPLSGTSVALSWTDNSSVETVYKVERATNPAGTWTAVTSSLAANTTTYTATGLTASTTYYFRVRAAKSTNNSLYSNNATATTMIAAPAKPTGLAATVASSTQINLTWTDVATEDSYQLERATASAGPWTVIAAALPANTTSFSATGLNEVTAYYFRISASNVGGTSAYSSTVNKTTMPHAPTNLTAVPTAYNKVSLTWTDNSSANTAYKVLRATNPAGTWTTVTSSLGANITTYTVTGLAANTTYYFRVQATKSTNVSLFSNDATATTPASMSNDGSEERNNVPDAVAAEHVPATVSDLTSAPNPANEGFNMVFQADRAADAQLVICDRIGHVTMRKAITTVPGENKLWIASGEWSNGLYVIALTSGQQTLVHKVLISKK